MLIMLLAAFFSAAVHAQQGVAVNNSGTPADPSAIFDASSSSQGMLLPRMTDAERDAIANPAEGLIIFNTTTKCFNYYKSNMWWELCGNCIGVQPPVPGSNSPVCSSDTLELTASFIAGGTYSWSGPNGFTSSLQNPVIPNSGTAASGTYSVIFTVNGCSSNPASVTATVNAVPSSAFTYNPSNPNVSQNVNFNPVVTGATYNWTFQSGNPASSTDQNPVVQWSANGTYDVSLTVTQNGCSSTTTNQITVSYYTPGTQTFNYTGSLQTWTVPAGITSVTMTVDGASGGNAANGWLGGYGARVVSQPITVTPGEVLNIIVGQQPAESIFGGDGCGGGGGGGSYVMRTGNVALVVAGGGGGACGFSNYKQNGQNASVTTSGVSSGALAGGTGGSGGSSVSHEGGGGAGYLTNGADGAMAGSGGKTPANGATGGTADPSESCGTRYGGYGGGGGGGNDLAGGGGGYSGGAAHQDVSFAVGAGGGGSYSISPGSSITIRNTHGNGQVVINW